MTTPHPHVVRDALRERLVTKLDLATRAGVHPNSLRLADADEGWNPIWGTLEKLCAAVADIKREQAEAAAE